MSRVLEVGFDQIEVAVSESVTCACYGKAITDRVRRFVLLRRMLPILNVSLLSERECNVRWCEIE